MNWIVFLFSIQLSWMPIYDTELYTDNLDQYIGNNLYYVQMETHADIFNFLYVEGGVKTSIRNILDNETFLPLESSYNFGAGFSLGEEKKKLTIGYNHLCIHSMTPYDYKINYSKEYNAGYDELFLKFQTKF